jgi:hypothetical protein
MKRPLLLLGLCFIIGALNAQEAFKAPELTDAAKYSMTLFQTNGFILNIINYGKSMGKTVEEIAAFTGDQFKAGWNKDMGFTGYVNWTMNIWTIFTPGSNLEIREQSKDIISFKTGVIFPDLKKNSPQFNVTYEEYLTFFKIISQKVADHMGAAFSLSVVDDGLLIILKKE